jgi:hypothetical protein
MRPQAFNTEVVFTAILNGFSDSAQSGAFRKTEFAIDKSVIVALGWLFWSTPLPTTAKHHSNGQTPRERPNTTRTAKHHSNGGGTGNAPKCDPSKVQLEGGTTHLSSINTTFKPRRITAASFRTTPADCGVRVPLTLRVWHGIMRA